MPRRGKKYQQAVAAIDRTKNYSLEEAIKLAKELAYSKFDEVMEIAIRLGIDPRHSDQMVRGAVPMPHGIGRSVRVVVFAKGEKAQEAEQAGADYVGGDELVEKVASGWLDFDKVVTTPDMMGSVRKLGKVLGPRGMMPNPKTGSLTFEIGKAVEELKAGKVEFRSDKGGNIHAPIGKVSMSEEALVANSIALLGIVLRSKPETAKGQYIKNIVISTTFGPGLKVDIGQAQQAASTE